MPTLSGEAAEFVKKLRAEELEKCKASFWYFIQKAWPYVNATPRLVKSWHMRVVAEHLEAVYYKKIRRLLINVPPGTSKSRIVSILWPAWVWLHDPAHQFSVTSHGDRIVQDFGQWLIKLLQSDWYKRLNPAIRVPANAAKGDIKIGTGGCWYGTTPHGQITGQHFDTLIFDDLIEPDNADKKENEFVCKWIPDTWESRVNDRATACYVGVMQRLRENDPADYCISRGWCHLCLPARYEGGDQMRLLDCGDVLICDERSEVGENLCPALLPEDELKRYERESPQVYAAQYQQRPAPPGGAVFDEAWLQKRHTGVPAGAFWILSVDAAFKETEESDPVSIQVWAQVGPDFYLVDNKTDRMGFTDTIKEIKKMLAKYPKIRAKIIEDKANGAAIVDLLSKRIPGFIAVDPDGGKESRAAAVTPFFEAGNVYLPDGAAWLPVYIQEMKNFPYSRHDDQVDATSQAINWLAKKFRKMWKAQKDVAMAMIGQYVAPTPAAEAPAAEVLPPPGSYTAWRANKLRGQ